MNGLGQVPSSSARWLVSLLVGQFTANGSLALGRVAMGRLQTGALREQSTEAALAFEPPPSLDTYYNANDAAAYDGRVRACNQFDYWYIARQLSGLRTI